MKKERKSRSRPINSDYLRTVIHARHGHGVRGFAQKTGRARSTIYNALKGEPIDEATIQAFVDADERIDKELLTAVVSDSDESQQISEGQSGQPGPAVFTLVSIKGGVGKTRIAVSLAAELARKCRVALVDVDVFTFGATRWFNALVGSTPDPLTFVDIALGASATDSRQVLSTEVEQSTSDPREGRLFFVPAHSEIDNPSSGVTARPIIIDWDIEEAQNAVKLLVEQMTRLDVDVIILDAHPGLMALTDVICREADCNILVSDCDVTTIQANWLLAWEIRHGQLAGATPVGLMKKPKKMSWRVAINRIPSPRTVAQYKDLVEQARDSALASVPSDIFRGELEPEATDPVFLLPELEAMRLDIASQLGPTSVRRLGGNHTVLATRNLVRRLKLDGFTPRLESLFPYARADNQISHHRLRTYIENYGDPWDPGSKKLDKPTLIASLAILVLLLANSLTFKFLPEDWPERTSLHTLVGILSSAVLCLIFFVCARTLHTAFRSCRTICWFIDASSLAELPLSQQVRSFEAGAYPELTMASPLFLQFAVFALLLPAAAVVGFQFAELSPTWKMATFLTTLAIIVSSLWLAPEKSSVLRVFRLFASRYTG